MQFVLEAYEDKTMEISNDFSALNMQGDMSQRNMSQGGLSTNVYGAAIQNDNNSCRLISITGGCIVLTVLMFAFGLFLTPQCIFVCYLSFKAILFLKGRCIDYVIKYNAIQSYNEQFDQFVINQLLTKNVSCQCHLNIFK